jgi:hypothetical protein
MTDTTNAAEGVLDQEGAKLRRTLFVRSDERKENDVASF